MTRQWKPMDVSGQIRSLSFGGILGGAIAYLAYSKFPQLTNSGFQLQTIVATGIAVGGITHRIIDDFIFKGLFRPIGKFASYYRKLAELEWLRKKTLIDKKTYTQIRVALTKDYFLDGVTLPRSRQIGKGGS